MIILNMLKNKYMVSVFYFTLEQHQNKLCKKTIIKQPEFIEQYSLCSCAEPLVVFSWL